jgi:small subunit ribosomal protein S5
MATKPQRRSRRGGDFDDSGGVEDQLVKLYRCATVVKGGRRFSFGALTVVGDRRGRVGYGYAKANEVPPSVEKSIKQARRRMLKVPLRGNSIPHRVEGRFGASRVMLIPASPGTGVIAGSAVRAVLELAGIKDVLTKCYGSTSPKNLVKATLDGLTKLRTRAMVEELRGVRLDHLPEEPALEAEATTEAYVAPEGRTPPPAETPAIAPTESPAAEPPAADAPAAAAPAAAAPAAEAPAAEAPAAEAPTPEAPAVEPEAVAPPTPATESPAETSPAETPAAPDAAPPGEPSSETPEASAGEDTPPSGPTTDDESKKQE